MRHTEGSRVSYARIQVVSLDELISRDGNAPLAVDLSLYDRSPRPSEVLEQRQAARALGAFLLTLSEREREILERFYWQHESQASIAVDFGVSKMAISKALARVLKRGRHAMAGHEPTMGRNVIAAYEHCTSIN
jgi:RNA polymerase sigma factor (sigma-70 family)